MLLLACVHVQKSCLFTRGAMHQKIILIPTLLMIFAGWMSATHSFAADELANSASVRVFQEADITLYPGEYCYGSTNPAAIHAASSGFSIFGTTKRVGMPETADMTGTYNEYRIQAGIPVTVMLQWEIEQDGVKASCGPIGSTFYPQTGRNYDISKSVTGACFIQVRELIETSPGVAETRPVPLGYSYKCADR